MKIDDKIREAPKGSYDFAVIPSAIPLGTSCPCGRGPATVICPSCTNALCRECFETHRCIPRETGIRDVLIRKTLEAVQRDQDQEARR